MTQECSSLTNFTLRHATCTS